MAAVLLTKMWLTNVTSLEMIGLQTGPERPRNYQARGEVRFYGAGRKRSIKRAGMAQTWKFTLQEMTLTQVETLRQWSDDGVTVLARDHRGQSMYGSFYEIEIDERLSQTPSGAFYTAAITLQQVDVVEGV